MLFNKLNTKVDEIRLSRQLQIYVEKLKPLLKSELIQCNIKDNMVKLHKASSNESVESQKLTIQYTAQHLGLTSVEGSGKIYISFDAKEFFLEISFADKIKVTLVNNGVPEEQMTISRVLQERDYTLFEEHLHGYMSVFNIPLAPRVKPLLFKALRALEEDLLSWSGVTNPRPVDPEVTLEAVNTSQIGYIIPSHGGVGIQILYHFHRNNMLRSKNLPLLSDVTSDTIKTHATRCHISVECSTSNHIPVQPIYMSHDEFMPLKQGNADYMEATFVLKLSKPVVMKLSTMNSLLKELENGNLVKDTASEGMFLELLLKQHGLKDRLEKTKDRSQVTLEFDREGHRYYIAKDTSPAVLVHRIPFTHPSQIPAIIHTLRQQQLFNNLLLSCHNKHTKNSLNTKLNCQNTNRNHTDTAQNHKDTTDYRTLDLMLKVPNSIECVLAHPYRETLAVVKFSTSWSGINVTSQDTLKCGAMSAIVAKYLSIPLAIHGFLQILRHHYEHDIQAPRRTAPDKSVEYDVTCSMSSQPPPMSQQHLVQQTTSHLSNMSNFNTYPLPTEPIKALPNPPDLTSMKRKRIISVGDQEGPKLKKPTKVVNFNEVPSIPSLSPMSGLTGVGPMKMTHQMPPIGPPSLKPAPIHPTSPSPQGLTIPCLSPAPHIRPGSVSSPARTGSSPQPGFLRMANPQKPALTKSVEQDEQSMQDHSDNLSDST